MNHSARNDVLSKICETMMKSLRNTDVITKAKGGSYRSIAHLVVPNDSEGIELKVKVTTNAKEIDDALSFDDAKLDD